MFAKLIQSLRGKPAQEVVAARFESARAVYLAGDIERAEALFVALAEEAPQHAEAWLHAAICAFKQGHVGPAYERVQAARKLAPADHEYLFQEAAIIAAMGRADEARAMCQRVLEMAPNYAAANQLWATIDFPGDNYLTFLPLLHIRLKPATYIEIGVDEGRSICFAGAHTRAIGVDPAPKIKVPLGPQVKIMPMTSDDFFNRHDVRAELGGQALQLGFIDGMHLFEFAFRDFINMEKLADPAGTILIHDCYPRDRRSAERERHASFWSGDIWRLILILKKYRPDLTVHTLALGPTGLGMVRGLDPASTVLGDRYDEIVAEFMALDYGVLDADKAGMLNFYAGDWEDMLTLCGCGAAPIPAV